MDPIRGVEIRAPCGDYYDRACILELFQAATRDESLFPPRCCRQRIPLESVQQHMTAELLNLFKSKTEEFSTLKRVYCARQSCSRFLGAQIESSLKWIFWPTYKCSAPGCGTETCSWCKKKATFGHRCDGDDGNDQRVLALARAQGWSRCPGCEQIIELNHGCFHMTCRCRTQFCYLCRARWKTCACPQWDERRLLAAAEARADAQLRRGAAPAPARAVAQDFRANPVARARPAQAALAPAGAVPAPAPTIRPAANPVRPAAGPAWYVDRRPVYGQVPVGRNPTVGSTPQRPAAATASQAHTGRQPATVTTPRNQPLAVHYRAVSRSTNVVNAAVVPDRATLIRTWVDRLRDDHDCNHAHWQYRRGGGHCESCHDRLPIYLLRCTGCEMLACRRCRQNRL
ncbi:hypothetical protein BKA93DRAFT_730067 [Sparassis latifolia]